MKKGAKGPTPAAAPPPPGAVKWASVDPRKGGVVDYSPEDNAAIEAAFQAGQGSVQLLLGGNPFTIRFSSMKQFNATGGSRDVRRDPPASRPPPAPLRPLLESDIHAALRIVQQADARIQEIVANEANRTYTMPRRFVDDDTACVFVMDHMIQEFFMADEMRSKYSFAPSEEAELAGIKFLDPVPNYFANAAEHSMFHRKMLSMFGLRNLIRLGPKIFEELRKRLFSGNPAEYGNGEGLAKMREFTGNTVDLDTPLLFCHKKDTLDTINMTRAKEGLPPFPSAQEMSADPWTHKVVFEMAHIQIDGFVQELRLTDAEKKARKLALTRGSEGAIPTASGNQDRGKWPVWFYNNVGIVSFHVNVPTMSEVYGSLLRAPFHLVKAYCETKLMHAEKPTHQRAMTEFFEDAVSDSCFNGKWKAIEMYVQKIEKEGTIADVLDKLQQEKQAELAAVLARDDDARSLETRWMKEQSAALRGRDPTTRQLRAITAADVDAWIAATN